MRRPWQIWLLYALSLLAVLPAMAWLTVKSLELDQGELVARRQAELEEDISRALWRMDALLTPLLAQEAARPDFVYRPRYATLDSSEGKQTAAKRAMSPLLAQPPDYVLLHFELHSDGKIASPQSPIGSDREWAIANGASAPAMEAADKRLAQLQPVLEREHLLAELPAQSLSEIAVNLPSAAVNANSLVPGGQNTVIANSYPAQPQSQTSGNSAQNQQLYGSQPNPAPRNFQLNPPLPQQFALAPQESRQEDEITGAAQNAAPNASEQNYESGRLQRSQSRGGNDLQNRGAAFQAYAQKAVVEQRNYVRETVPGVQAVEGVSRPLWLGPRLILARRVQSGGETLIQGCWLDWDRLQDRLRAEVADLLPEVKLSRVSNAAPIKLSRLLATLPVELSVPPPVVQNDRFSPLRVSLLVAWGCLLAVAILGGVMLQSIVTLSERRGAFVAAVTHELRTPLTTFRMYAEMLAEGMVPEGSQRQQYLETLRIEADRLHHLVDNVLQYARLERGRSGRGRAREVVSAGELIERSRVRLEDRAEQAGMQLVVDSKSAAAEARLQTDSAAVEQILFNLVDNACKYAVASDDRRIHLELAADGKFCQIAVRDHGPGIAAPGRRKLFQPFSKSVHEAASSAPGVGLGLALSRRLAKDLGGQLVYVVGRDAGAAFVLTLPRSA